MDINYKRIGQKLQEARKLKGMSIEQVASDIHFTIKSVVFAESGQVEMDMKFFLSLCNVLNVTPNDLLEGQFFAQNEQSLQEKKMLAEMREILRDMGGDEDLLDDFVIKDTDAVFQEIRDYIRDEQIERRKNEYANSASTGVVLKSERASLAAKNKGGNTHW